MTPEEMKARIAEENPDALFLDGFDEALVGPARRCGQPTLAAYDVDAIIGCLIDQGMSGEEADEHFQFNIEGAWMGPNTPILVHGLSCGEWD